jgi:PAS domain S-box-containing protein
MLENWTDALFDTLTEAALALDGELRLTAINAAALKLYGVTRSWAVGRHLTELIGNELDPQVSQRGWETVNQGEVWRGIVWHRSPAGRRFRAELSVRGLSNENGVQTLIAVVRDVTLEEARRIRQAVLTHTLRAVAEAKTPEAVQTATLEGLTQPGAADAVVLRGRDGDTYPLIAWQGIDISVIAPVHAAILQPERANQLERGEVISINLHELPAESWSERFLNAGFCYIESVGQRFGGQLIGTLNLLYREVPVLGFALVLPQLGTALGTQLVQAQQRRELERRNRLLELFKQIDNHSLAGMPVNTLLETLAEGLRTLFAVQWTSIGFAPRQQDTITWLARVGPTDGSQAPPERPSVGTPSPLEGIVKDAVNSSHVTRFGGPSRFGLYAPAAMMDGTLVLSLVDHPGDFGLDEEREAQFVTTQFALAYQRALDNERLGRERAGLEALVEATRTMRTVTDRDTLFHMAAQFALETTHADTAAVLLLEHNPERLQAVATAGVGAASLQDVVATRERGLSWQVIDTGTPSIQDVLQQRREGMIALNARQGTYIGVPIRTDGGPEGQVVGVLAVDTHHQGQAFGENDLSRLVAVSEALGNAWARVRALEQAEQRAQSFERLAELSSNLEKLDDPNEIVREGLRVLRELSGFTVGVYAVIEADRVQVTHVEGIPADRLAGLREDFEVPPDRGVFHEAIATGEPLIIPDYRARPEALASFTALGLRSAIIAPIYLNGQVHGFVGVGSLGEPMPIPANMVEVVSFLTGRVARSLERAKQIQEIMISETTAVQALDQAEERAHAFLRLATLSAELEALESPRTIARHGLETLLELTDLDGALYAEITQGHVEILEHLGRVPDEVFSWYDGNPVNEWADQGLLAALSRTEPLIVEDYLGRSEAVQGFKDLGIRTFVIASVRFQERPQGFVAAASLGRTQALPGGIAEFVQFLTGRISRALERAAHLGEVLQSEAMALRALGQAEDRAGAFIRLAQLSADLEALEEPHEIAQRALATLIDLTNLEAAVYVRLDEGRVRLVESRGVFPSGFLDIYKHSDGFAWGGTFVRQAFNSLEGVFTAPEAREFPELSAPAEAGVRSLVMAPVRIGEQFVGYVAAASFSASVKFPPGTPEIARFIGGRIARALERITQTEHLRAAETEATHARDDAEQRARAFEQLAELSARLESLDDVHAIVTEGLETLLKLTGLDATAYYELIDNQLRLVEARGAYPEEFTRLRERQRLSVERGLFGEVFRQGNVAVVKDYLEYENALPEFASLGLRTALSAPVQFKGDSRGFIGAASFGSARTLPTGIMEVVGFISTRISRAIERADQVSEILATRAASFQALAKTLEARDFETKGHTDRVTRLVLDLGREFNLDRQNLQWLEWGAYLHDIGKIAIPDSILSKPGPLTPDEWVIVRQHPGIGYRILEDLHFLPLETLQIVRHHQERTDGSGYPDGLLGAEIPFLARLFAVVDVYDALTSTRPYKPPWTHADAVEELRRQSGVKLDADVLAAFLRMLERQRGS